jgi:hypothetical protein
VMALSFIVAVIGMPRGRVAAAAEPGPEPASTG